MVRYQTMVYDAVMLKKLPIDMPGPVTPQKRPHGGDDEKGRDPKRRMDKRDRVLQYLEVGSTSNLCSQFLDSRIPRIYP